MSAHGQYGSNTRHYEEKKACVHKFDTAAVTAGDDKL